MAPSEREIRLGEHVRGLESRVRGLIQRDGRQQADLPPLAPKTGREYDRLGRPQPFRVDALMMLRSTFGAQLAEQFTGRVPAEMYAQVDEGVVEVSCPCGDTHLAPINAFGSGECGRTFLYDGHEVLVARDEAASL